MLQFAFDVAIVLKPLAPPLRAIVGYSLLGIIGWSLVNFVWDILAVAKRMHQIPCSNCRFFTNDYRLKCTVNPHIANTEQAIDCPDCDLVT